LSISLSVPISNLTSFPNKVKQNVLNLPKFKDQILIFLPIVRTIACKGYTNIVQHHVILCAKLIQYYEHIHNVQK